MSMLLDDGHPVVERGKDELYKQVLGTISELDYLSVVSIRPPSGREMVAGNNYRSVGEIRVYFPRRYRRGGLLWLHTKDRLDDVASYVQKNLGVPVKKGNSALRFERKTGIYDMGPLPDGVVVETDPVE